MSRRSLLFVLLLTLGLAACERQEPREVPPAARIDEPTAIDPAMEQTSECINHVEGFAVEYPATWQTNTDEVLGPCMLFDPEPVEVPPASELPLEIAIQIGFEAVPFATLSREVLGRRDLTRERTTVDGREALRLESETTGEGLHDRGIRMYQYFVDLGDTTMVAATHDVGVLPFERKRRILDAMMATFDFREPERGG
jgi:predicted small lipoprotein YifL